MTPCRNSYRSGLQNCYKRVQVSQVSPIVHTTGGQDMGNNTNVIRTAQLGMPFGTAVHRLRKNIIFSMMKRLGEDACFKCSLPIDTVDEMSMEHKQPWLNRDVALFWDLDNLAWSHLACNRPDNPVYPSRRIDPAGMQYCWRCKKNLLLSEFHKDRHEERGLCTSCKSCYRTDRNRLRQSRRNSGD